MVEATDSGGDMQRQQAERAGETKKRETPPKDLHTLSGHISAWGTSLMETSQLKFNLLSDHVAYLPPESANPMVPTQTSLHWERASLAERSGFHRHRRKCRGRP